MTVDEVSLLRKTHSRLVEWFKSNPEDLFSGAVRVVHTLFKRANDTVGAILCLYDNGYYSQAMGLTRVIFELAIDVAIIASNSDKISLLEEYNRRLIAKWWKVWSKRDNSYVPFYKQAQIELEQFVPLERRKGKEAKRWMRDRWGYNLRALTEVIDPTGCFTKIYDVVVCTEQVHLHGGLVPECCQPDNRSVALHILDNANYLLDIVEHCRKFFLAHPLPDFQDLTKDFDTLLGEVLAKST